MEYALVLVTHGPAPHLERVLAAFAEMAHPAPAQLHCVVDGPGRLPPVAPLGPWYGHQHGSQQGFCSALLTGWQAVAPHGQPVGGDIRYAFWLENDFLLTRPVDLELLARELDADPMLAQVALARQPLTAEERGAGGLARVPRHMMVRRFGPSGFPHLRHRSYFTTNPSLMRLDFMARNLPHYEGGECEGKFGLDLVSRGYDFGLWGDGEPWVEHLGTRTGFGY